MASDFWWELDGAPGRPARCLGIFLLLSCCGWWLDRWRLAWSELQLVRDWSAAALYVMAARGEEEVVARLLGAGAGGPLAASVCVEGSRLTWSIVLQVHPGISSPKIWYLCETLQWYGPFCVFIWHGLLLL